MSDDANKIHSQDKDNNIQMPDFTEVWKEMYFSNENDWARALKGFIATETFVSLLDKTLEQYLAYSKVSRQQMEKIGDKGITPTKKDIARVAELVISMEEKIDMMEFQLFGNFGKMTDNLLKMADYQGSIKEEIISLKQEIAMLNERIDKLVNDPKAKKVNERSSKRNTGEPKTRKSKPISPE